ncbi:MAG: hypothetical protein CL916_10170 [Deltaproteobacteria bacterium]|nr:hypothetical protein [Deltaproteobacteria bacterium]
MKAIIEAYFHERVGYHTLIRALIAHKTWIIPAQKQDKELHPSLFQHEGRTLLTAYSQKEYAPEQLETITVDGLWLFDQLPDIIDALVIDPQSSHALQLPRTKFGQLKQWRDAVHIEQQLAQPTFDANILEQLLQYQGYCLPLIQSPSGKRHIALAPDPEGRKLAAIFTAKDSLSAFVQHAGTSLGEELIIDEPSGEALLPYLTTLPIDGIVFNCYGPPTPKALHKESLERLLAERDHHE